VTENLDNWDWHQSSFI